MTISVRVITRAGSSKVAREAFELARSRKKQLTVVHKDTVFKLGCGMFVEECKRIAKEYPDVQMQEAIVDTFAMRLVMTPQKYDVVVTTNMFGDILADEAAAWSAASAWPPACVPARATRWRRPRTARRLTSPGRISPTRTR